MTSDRTSEQPSRFRIPFLLLLSSYCVWIFTLPLFPSLDGSLHLYYASVMGSLLSGSKDFASYYFIRHILPPYALHYYFLIAVAHFVGYVMADKLLVCLIFLTTAFGFRYLARCLGPSGDVMSLFIIPLLLSWPLGMGFYNYCLSTGLALWAMGFWYRAVQRRSHRLWLAFLTAVFLMVLTHPVPLLVIYILIGVDVALCLQGHVRRSEMPAVTPSSYRSRFGWDSVYALLACGTVAYIAYFTSSSRMVANVLHVYNRKAELFRLIKLSTLAMFSGSHSVVMMYRFTLYAILVLGIFLACIAVTRQRSKWTYTPASAVLACSLLLMIVIPILPPVINGANYFSQRLVILVWIGVLAAASAYPGFTRPKENVLATCILLYSIAVLALANSMIRPVAARISQIETTPRNKAGLTGLTLSLPDAPTTSTLDYIPYYWAGARYFRRTHSTLLNGGWLYESYVPLGSNVNKLSDQLTPYFQDSPGDIYQLLLHSPSARKKILPHADLLLFTGEISSQRLLQVVRKLDESEPSRQWICESRGWYSDCTAAFAASAQGRRN